MHDIHGLHLVADDHVGGGRDEVVPQRLRDERERAGNSEVALNDLEIIVLGDELHVEGSGDEEGVGDLAGDLADLGQGLRIHVRGGSYQGGIAGVDT